MIGVSGVRAATAVAAIGDNPPETGGVADGSAAPQLVAGAGVGMAARDGGDGAKADHAEAIADVRVVAGGVPGGGGRGSETVTADGWRQAPILNPPKPSVPHRSATRRPVCETRARPSAVEVLHVVRDYFCFLT